MKVKDLTQGVLNELEALGYAKKTLEVQRGCILSQIKRWFDVRSDGELTKVAVEDYFAEIAARLQSGSIGKSYYKQLRCAVKRLCEYAENKSINLVYTSDMRKFQPSIKAIQIIENALANTELRDDFKYKLHSVLRKFFCFIEAQNLCVRDITRDVMVSFVHHCCDSNSGDMNYIVRSLLVLANYLVSLGTMVNEPDFKFIVPKRKRRKIIPAFSEVELAAILNSIDKTTQIGKRDYAIILLAIGTGLRGGDIANLKLADIDWKSQSISIVQGKTENSLKIPLNGQICNAISDYILNSRPKTDYANVFLSACAPLVAFKDGRPLGQILDRACSRARVEKKKGRRFHSLRRTFGTWLAAEEIQITTIAQMLGHIKLDSSVPYLSFNDTQMYSCAMGFGEIPLKGGIYYGN